jgi:uncharacterized PurR-regulated membrane protein YhhQ (DUF165 family)
MCDECLESHNCGVSRKRGIVGIIAGVILALCGVLIIAAKLMVLEAELVLLPIGLILVGAGFLLRGLILVVFGPAKAAKLWASLTKSRGLDW